MQFDKHLLFKTMSVQSASYNQGRMQQFVRNTAIKLGATTVTTDAAGNIYVTKGTAERAYPCVVAHLDTVHRILPGDQFMILKEGRTWFAFNPIKRETVGIGGDDKVGIFIALSMLQQFDHLKLAFFVDEEVGCRGSSVADMAFFEDTTFVIQCDRKGYHDVVQSIYGEELFGDEFAAAIAPYNDKFMRQNTTRGGMTDVQTLKERGLAVAATNLSCGYWLPHTDQEYIDLVDVQLTNNYVAHLIKDLGERVWHHEDPNSWSRYRTNGTAGYVRGGAYGGWHSWDDSDEGYSSSLGTQAAVGVLSQYKPRWKTSSDNQYAGKTAEIAGRMFTRFSICALCDSREGLQWVETGDFRCLMCGYLMSDAMSVIADNLDYNDMPPLTPPYALAEGDIDAIPTELIDPSTDWEREQVATAFVDNAYNFPTYDTVEAVQQRLAIAEQTRPSAGRTPAERAERIRNRKKVQA